MNNARAGAGTRPEALSGIGTYYACVPEWSAHDVGTMSDRPEIDESRFPYGYVPPHLAERVRNWRSLSVSERLQLTSELSEAAWAKISVVRDPNQPMDKTIRRVTR